MTYTTTYVVSFDGELYGPFEREDDCYKFAAQLSRVPNDWEPIELHSPSVAIAASYAERIRTDPDFAAKAAEAYRKGC